MIKEILPVTETFFDKHNGDIVVVTRIDEKHDGVYGKYCTGPYNKDREYFFRLQHDVALA